MPIKLVVCAADFTTILNAMPMFLKVIACEIAVRELYHVAATCPHLVDFEFLTQGYHDIPARGREEIQTRIDAVPAGKYDAILLGYGLCSNILSGIKATHTRLVVPRAHDCITFFLGSKERYQSCFSENPGTYYYSSGWLECAQRRGIKGTFLASGSLSSNANMGMKGTYEDWGRKYGEEQARFLMEEMGRWAESYTHGTLIDFNFTRPLKLKEQVCAICKERNWTYSELEGDLSLLRRLVDGDWSENDFLTVEPGQQIMPSFDEKIITSQ
jgi:hypothetical protein